MTGREQSDGVPPQAIAYLEAVRRYYQPGVTRPPRNADIAAAHLPRMNPRTWDRRKELLQNGSLGGRNWLEVWPPPQDWHPSWEDMLPLQPPLPDDDGLVHMIYEDVYDKNGKLIEHRWLRGPDKLTNLVIAAWAYALLDMGDGRLDGIIRFCKLLAGVAHQLT